MIFSINQATVNQDVTANKFYLQKQPLDMLPFIPVLYDN